MRQHHQEIVAHARCEGKHHVGDVVAMLGLLLMAAIGETALAMLPTKVISVERDWRGLWLILPCSGALLLSLSAA